MNPSTPLKRGNEDEIPHGDVKRHRDDYYYQYPPPSTSSPPPYGGYYSQAPPANSSPYSYYGAPPLPHYGERRDYYGAPPPHHPNGSPPQAAYDNRAPPPIPSSSAPPPASPAGSTSSSSTAPPPLNSSTNTTPPPTQHPYDSRGAPPPSPYDSRGPPPSPYDSRGSQAPPPSSYSNGGYYSSAPPPPSSSYYGGYDSRPPPPPSSYYGYDSRPPPPPYHSGHPPSSYYDQPPPPSSSYYGGYDSRPPPPPSSYYGGYDSRPPPPPHHSGHPPPPHYDPYGPPPPSHHYGPPPPTPDRYDPRGPPPPSSYPPYGEPPRHDGPPPQVHHDPYGPPPPRADAEDPRGPPPPTTQYEPSRKEMEEQEHERRSKMREENRKEHFSETTSDSYSRLSRDHNGHHEAPRYESRHQEDLNRSRDRDRDVRMSSSSVSTSSSTSVTANNSIVLSSKGSSSGSSNRAEDESYAPVGAGAKRRQNDNRRIVKLATNHYQCKITNSLVYMYSVDFSPKLDSRDTRIKALREFENEIGPFQFDGMSLMIAKNKQPSSTYQAKDGTTITVNFTREMKENDASLMQFYNVFLKKLMTLMEYSIMGRQYFSSKLKTRLERYNLEVWPGFFTSISQNERGLSLVADISHKIVRTESVLNIIEKGTRDRLNDPQIEEMVKGRIVVTKYNNKTYRVASIAWGMKPTDPFETDSGRTTFEAYYAKQHPNHKIRDLTQPLITTEVKRRGTKETIYLVPELCFITGMSEDLTQNHSLMQDLSSKIHIDPKDRHARLREFVKSLQDNQKVVSESNRWGISFAPSMEVDGRSLQLPRLMRNNKPIGGRWVFIASSNDRHIAKQFIPDLCRMAGLPHPESEIFLDNPRPQSYTREMEEQIKAKGKPDFFFCVIPQKNDFYNHIKRITLVQTKVLTQCALARTISKGKPQIVSKIFNQIQAKLGIAPWTLSIDKTIEDDTMVVGIDIGHNTDQRGKSVVGICATLNREQSMFYSTAILQSTPGKDIIDSLRRPIESALEAYYKKNNRLPKVVIIYRDGVGDGMLPAVHKQEVSAVREAINNTPQSMGDKPKLIYIIVKKNTNTRFFDLGNNNSNPQSGTVISEGCVHNDWYDFYLIAQKSAKGTINPTHFHVITDETDIKESDLQQFTYNMCYLYFNFDSPVRVPSVCQYSKKLAFLIGRSVHNQSSEDLSLKLYYL